MGNCLTCGQKAGRGKDLCDNCVSLARERKAREVAAEQARLQEEQARQQAVQEEQARQAEVQRQQQYERYIAERLAGLRTLHSRGITPYLYRVLLMDAQSQMNDQKVGSPPDTSELQQFGWLGWEAVGVIPTTYGQGLENTDITAGWTKSWGAGIGGLVVGAYVLMRLPITAEALRQNESEIVALLREEFTG